MLFYLRVLIKGPSLAQLDCVWENVGENVKCYFIEKKLTCSSEFY